MLRISRAHGRIARRCADIASHRSRFFRFSPAEVFGNVLSLLLQSFRLSNLVWNGDKEMATQAGGDQRRRASDARRRQGRRDDSRVSTIKCEPHRHDSSTSSSTPRDESVRWRTRLDSRLPVAYPLLRGPDRLSARFPALRIHDPEAARREVRRKKAELRTGWFRMTE